MNYKNKMLFVLISYDRGKMTGILERACITGTSGHSTSW